MTDKIPVMCMNCNHVFRTNAKVRRCSKCHSYNVQNVEDVPRVYGGMALQNLRKEFEEFKVNTIRMVNKHTDKIKDIEGKVQ